MAVYLRLALLGMRKNGRLYLPYLCTCIGMVAMFYIIAFLPNSDFMAGWRGEDTLKIVLTQGIGVMTFFAALLLFYTNSFLIRRRKREFGLYHVLGMGKGNIGRVLLWESLITAVLALAIGLFCGVAFSKLAELALARIVGGEINYRLTLSPKALRMALLLFGAIFLLLFLNGLGQVWRANSAELLRSESQGEKPPKGNWLFGLLGVLLLAGAYWRAVSIRDPLSAMTWFFAAVLMVIAGTYLVFLAGSVLLCRLLQKNKRYYYRKQHFVSVSSMVYRMKRNGAGLASICILATMVLVMIASTACLYFGAENSLHARYPRDLSVDLSLDLVDYDFDRLEWKFREAVGDTAMTDILTYRYLALAGIFHGDTFDPDPSQITSGGVSLFSDLVYLYLLDGSDGTLFGGETYALGPGEVLVYPVRTSYDPDTITLGDATYRVVGMPETLALSGKATADIVPSIFVVMPDYSEAREAMGVLNDRLGQPMAEMNWYYGFNTDAPLETQLELLDRMSDACRAEFTDTFRAQYECLGRERSDYYSLFGGLYFLGILLSIVFLASAVLIIYYKQVSEGYEDAARFEVMQKVGMTKREIRQSINSQMLTVFLLPLTLSVLHLAFAFPMLRKILLVFGINNLPLLLLTAAVSVAVFALFYTAVYRITAGAYYKIVSE